MAYSDVILADSPERYWPLSETSGTNANELVANEDATASGMVFGGADAPTGIGGKCPTFTGVGTEFITLRAGALLGGSAAYTVEAWVRYTPTNSADTSARCFYGEIGSAGNDRVLGEVDNGTTQQHLRHAYGDDAAVATRVSSDVFVNAQWILMHLTRSGATAGTWWNAGKRMTITDMPAGSTWTNAGVAARLGVQRAGANPWKGQIAHVAVYNRVLSQAEILSHYEAGTPLQREIPDRNWWKPIKAVWNQRLDDPANPPTIASNSAATVTALVNQSGGGYGAPYPQTGGGPIFVVDNSTPTQRVRIVGGENNTTFNHPDLYNAFGIVPVPAALVVGTNVDKEVQIYNKDSDELWEFWVMGKTLLGPEFVTPAVSGFGTLPAGTYLWAVFAVDAGGARGLGLASGSLVLNGSQGALVSWGTSEAVTQYEVCRRLSSAGQWTPLARVSAATHSFIDDGSLSGTPFTSNPNGDAVTTDWGAKYGGYINGTDDSIGVYEPPHQNWGASATSLPLWGGTITIAESAAAVSDVDAIQHAITMAVDDSANSHVYPAQRHDYFPGANNIQEGTRFQLNPAYDISTIANPWLRAVAKAFQVYGGYVRDVSGGLTAAYVEDHQGLGRNPYPYVYQGKQSYEVFSGFPWSSMRVIDPAWTLTQTLPAPVLIETLTDNFNNNVIDPAVWLSSFNATETGGQLRISYGGGSYGNVTSIGGGGGLPPFTLISSKVSAHPVQIPTGSGDQMFMRVASQIDMVKCRTDFTVADGILRATYTTPANTTVNVAEIPYDPVTHAWWRISESGGVVSFDTSSNGWTWTQFASYAWSSTGWPGANLANIVVLFVFGNYNATLGRPDFVVDSFNLGPLGAPPIDLPTPLTLDPHITALVLDGNETAVVLDG